MRIALFVEGAPGAFNSRTASDIERLWNDRIRPLFGYERFTSVIPISKKHLVSMDPVLPKMSGASEPLDHLIARELRKRPFDAALILWDLVPAWNPSGVMCRWNETLDLYRGLSMSDVLPVEWREAAAQRLDGLASRSRPSDRSRTPALLDERIVGVCMEPTFEALLCCNERALRRALGLDGQSLPNWPSWSPPRALPSDQRISLAIAAAVAAYRIKGKRRRPPWLGQVPSTYAQGKDAWSSFLLGRLFEDEQFLISMQETQFIQRLAELTKAS